MPKFPNIPRLTIVVPHAGEAESFETTLASVLQNRPESCEVIVPHAGDYDDPFELSEEVHFVDAGSRCVIEQIGQAAQVARGRFVQVIADGHQVSANWSDEALTWFEHHDAGVVVPVVRRGADGAVRNIGWRRSGASACELVAAGREEVPAMKRLGTEGGFLTTCFWRRDLLRSLSGTYRGSDLIEASMVYGLLANKAGWRCVVASECVMQLGDDIPVDDYQDQVSRNHRRLQAIADRFSHGGWGKSLPRFAVTLFSDGIGSAVRRATAPLAAKTIDRCLRASGVLNADDDVATLRIPIGSQARIRNAA